MLSRTRYPIIPATLIAAVSLVLSSCSNDSAALSEVPFVAVNPSSTSATDRAIVDAQKRLQADNRDDDARHALAQAFLQKAREIADPTLYTKADGILDDLGKRHPDDISVQLTSGSLALSQHRFKDALMLGRKVLEQSPDSELALGVVVDAQNELGQYEGALKDTEAMVDLRPGVTSLSRVSYARELRGDTRGAIGAMRQAISAGGSGGGENTAYLQVQLGDLLFKSGDLDEADGQYVAAETSFPGYAAAKAGRAQLAMARNSTQDAIPLWEEVMRVQPLPGYAQAHGDALAAIGRQSDADRSYALVDVIFELERANGVKADFEAALYRSDHGADKETVSLARKALKERPTIFAHDALAWNLYRTGNVAEAAKESAKAVALGSKDPLLRFHAAAIADANNQPDAAREHLNLVIDGNPRFSAAYAPQLTSLQEKLGL